MEQQQYLQQLEGQIELVEQQKQAQAQAEIKMQIKQNFGVTDS